MHSKTLIDMMGYFIYRNAWIYDRQPHEEKRLSNSEADALLSHGGIMVRNTYDFDCPEETSFWYVIKDQYLGMDELSSRVRNKVRHAFQYFDYQKITYKQLLDNVFPILEDTFANYKIHDRKMNRDVFSKYLEQCQQKNYDYWGIIKKDTRQIVGFCTVKIWDDSCEIGYTGVISDYTTNGYYPYYGLYHYLNEYYLCEKKFRYVSDGSRTVTNHSQIHDYLIHYFHYRKAYCKIKIRYKWWFGTIVKVLYPFRNIIWNKNVKAVLKMHGMQTKS